MKQRRRGGRALRPSARPFRPQHTQRGRAPAPTLPPRGPPSSPGAGSLCRVRCGDCALSFLRQRFGRGCGGRGRAARRRVVSAQKGNAAERAEGGNASARLSLQVRRRWSSGLRPAPLTTGAVLQRVAPGDPAALPSCPCSPTAPRGSRSRRSVRDLPTGKDVDGKPWITEGGVRTGFADAARRDLCACPRPCWGPTGRAGLCTQGTGAGDLPAWSVKPLEL